MRACVTILLALGLGCSSQVRELIVANGDSGVCRVSIGAAPCQVISRMPDPDLQIIDGAGDDFCGVGALVFEARNAAATSPSPAPDLPEQVTLRVAWSPGYFHSHVHVSDANVIPSTGDVLWDGDAIEYFVAPPSTSGYDGSYSTGADRGPRQIVLSPPGPDKPARGAVYLDYVITGQVTTLPAEYFAGRLVSDGYELELRLPWGSVTDPPASGKRIAFDFAIDVQDSPDAGQRQLQGTINQTFVDGSELCGLASGQAAWPACDTRTWCQPALE